MSYTDLPAEIAEMAASGALFAINHSGGKDSQAMTIRLRAAGISDDQLVIVHAPLGRVEWPGTLAHIRRTVPGLPLILAHARTDLLSMVRRRGFWPTPAIRQCTSDLKRGPITRELRRHLKAHLEFGGKIVNCTGLRADESPARAKRAAITRSERNIRAGRSWIDWLPILDLNAADVFDIIANAGQRPHWIYGKGLRRCSCSFCIMGTQGDLRIAARLRPALFEEYAALEDKIGHTFSPSRIPLRELVASGDAGATTKTRTRLKAQAREKSLDIHPSKGVNKTGTYRG